MTNYRVSVFLLLFITLICASCFRCTKTYGKVFIIKNGAAQADIITSAGAPPSVHIAAKQLQIYIQKISGAKLPIIAKPTGAAVHIYVGKSAYTQKLGVTANDLKYGAYKIVSGANWLVLIGNDKTYSLTGWLAPLWKGNWGQRQRYAKKLREKWQQLAQKKSGYDWRICNLPLIYKQQNLKLGLSMYDCIGTLNAVCSFLRSLGVRWYMPGKLGEVVPQKKSIALPNIKKTVKPDFQLRRIYLFGSNFYGPFPFQLSKKSKPRQIRSAAYKMWLLHLGINYDPSLLGANPIAHGMSGVLQSKIMQKAQPQYYRLKRNGEIDYSHPRLSSKGFLNAQVKYARLWFKTFPRQPALSIMPPDGWVKISQTPEDLKQFDASRPRRGQMSNYVWDFENKVAAQLYKTNSDKKVLNMTYNLYSLAPTNIKQLSPNLVVMIHENRETYNTKELRQQIKNTRQAFIKLYQPNEQTNRKPNDKHIFIWTPANYAPSTLKFAPHTISWDLRSLKGISYGDIDRFNATHDAGAALFLNAYITSRCLWNADLNIDALLQEYYKEFYGPAAAPMKTLIDYLEYNWRGLKDSPEKITKVLSLIKKAQKSAPQNSIYARRVNLVAKDIHQLSFLLRQFKEGHKNAKRIRPAIHASKPAKIDGKTDGPFWQSAHYYGGSRGYLKLNISGKRAKIKTYYKLIWHKDALYIALECNEPDIKKLHSNNNRDQVEILLETQPYAYYKILVSPSGQTTFTNTDKSNIDNANWHVDIQIATHIDYGKNRWTAEIRIPAPENLNLVNPKQNKTIQGWRPTRAFPWYINIFRHRVSANGEIYNTALSPTGTNNFDVLSKFAQLAMHK